MDGIFTVKGSIDGMFTIRGKSLASLKILKFYKLKSDFADVLAYNAQN